MTKNSLAFALAAFFMGMAGESALAAPISATAGTAAGTTYNATGIYDHETYGGNIGMPYGGMDGMRVTATFTNGQSETAIWASTNATDGKASGTGWSLAMSGNTNWWSWVLSNAEGSNRIISGLRLEGLYGLVAFDYEESPELSPGSSSGWKLTSSDAVLEGPDDLVVSGTYSDRLLVDGQFYGDLYLTLELKLLGATGLGAGEILEFSSDTDNIKAVPEPGTLALGLIGLGILGMGLTRRRG